MIRRFVFMLFLLCLPSFAFGQALQRVVDISQYPSTTPATIPLNDGQAILVWSFSPFDSNKVVSASIIPSVTRSKDFLLNRGNYGYYATDLDSNPTIRTWYSVITATTFYSAAGNGPTEAILTDVNNLLSQKNLGTVEQRQAYIASFKLKDVQIVDTAQIMQNFQDLLGPWATIAVGFAIALFCLELGTRNTKQLAGDAAKEATASDRRVVNREIRDDPIAGQFRAHMDNLASVMRNTYGFHDASTRAQARDLFEQAARDYASYKKSRGWTV